MILQLLPRPIPLLTSFLAAAFALPATGRSAERIPPPSPTSWEVEASRDLAYYDDKGADKVRHKLDVFRPRGGEKRPVVFFVHGGVWVAGSKDFPNYYS